MTQTTHRGLSQGSAISSGNQEERCRQAYRFKPDVLPELDSS